MLETRKRVLGDDHPSTLNARHELIKTLVGQRRLIEAVAGYRALLDAQRVILGERHPDTLATHQDLVKTVIQLENDWTEAGALFHAFAVTRSFVLQAPA